MSGGGGVYLGGAGPELIFNGDTLTHGMELLRIAEGLSPQTSLSDVWQITMYRRTRDLESKRTDAFTLARAIQLFSEGGDFMQMAGHLYPKTDIELIQAERQVAEEDVSALRRLDMFRRIARRFDE